MEQSFLWEQQHVLNVAHLPLPTSLVLAHHHMILQLPHRLTALPHLRNTRHLPNSMPQQNPYAVPQYAPPPPQVPLRSPSRNRGKRIALIVGLGLLALILVGAGVFTLVHINFPSQGPYPPNTGTLVLNDPLHDNSRGYKWDETPADPYGTTCGFMGGAYHTIAGDVGSHICRPGAANLDFSDLTYEVKIKIAKGDIGGIVFPGNPTTNFRYIFTVDIRGNYTLSKDDGSGNLSTLKSGTNVAIDNGPAPSNLPAIVAIGNIISLYVNAQLVAQAQDTSYKRGQIGIYANTSSYGNASDIIASDARVWKL